MKYCEDCGSKVFSLGCVNCNESLYIEEMEYQNNVDELVKLNRVTTNGEIPKPPKEREIHLFGFSRKKK